MKTLTDKQLIAAAFSALHFLNNKSWTNYRDDLHKLCATEERGHRGFAPDFAGNHPGAASVADCARMFAVHRIAEYLTGTKPPGGGDYLHCQKSCFYASALVAEYGDEIRAAWAGLDIDRIAKLDYVKLVQVAA